MGAYRIMRRVSPPGGYLETYAGQQTSSDKAVLLKHLVTPPTSIDRLLENLRNVRGPALPPVLEVGNSSDGVWIVIEGSEGGSGVALAATERLKAGVEGIVAVILAVGAIERGEDGVQAVVILLRDGI